MIITIKGTPYVSLPVRDEDSGVHKTHYLELQKGLSSYLVEQKISGGLGFERLNHHEDTSEGLRKHLAEMELEIEKRKHFLENNISRQMFRYIIVLGAQK